MRQFFGYLALGLLFGSGLTMYACSNHRHTPPEADRDVFVNRGVLESADYRDREVLIKFDRAMTPEAIASLQRKCGLATVEILRGQNVYHMKIIDGKSVRETIDTLKRSPGVIYAEPNFSRRID